MQQPRKDSPFSFKQMPGLCYRKNTDLVYQECNLQYAEFVGLASPEEILNKTTHDFAWSQDIVEQFNRDEAQVILLKQPLTSEYQFHVKNTTIFLHFEFSPFYDAEGHLIGLLASGFDITAIRLKEKKFESEYRLIEDVLYQLPGLIYWKNLNSEYMVFNRNVVALAGLTREELKGKKDEELNWGKEASESFKKDDQEVIEKGSVQTTDYQIPIKRADGNWMIVHTEKTRFFDREGNIKGILGIAIDVTDQKLLTTQLREEKERAESAVIAKTNFTRNMDHSILTPFSGVYGLLEQMEKEETDPVKKEELHVAYLSAKELLTLCQHMLDSMRITSNEDPILEMKLDLKKLLEGLVDLEKAAVHAKNLELLLDYPDDLPTIFLSDAYRLKRIMMNLVDNAIKFTEKGYVKLRVSLAKKLDDKNLIIKISVEDTGIGIAPENHDYIYQSFSRVHPSNTGKYPGLGLGLFTVKHFIEDLGGEIDLISSLEKGSIFICTFPMKRPLVDEIIHKDDKPFT